MADRKRAREAIAEDIRALADDLRAFVEDPAKRARKERRWRALYGVFALAFAVGARRLAAKAWSILTGEQPPTKGQPAQAGTRERAPEAAAVPSAERR